MSKPCKDPLDDYVDENDHLDVLTALNIEPTYGLPKRPSPLLDEKAGQEGKKKATPEDIQDVKKYASALLEDYGKGYTQTITDQNNETYTERFIIKAVRKLLNDNCDKYIVIPDYSPTDGRLHFHGVLTFKRIKDLAKLRRQAKPFGWLKIDQEPTAKTPEYIVKIYERNSKTPPNTRIEELPLRNILRK